VDRLREVLPGQQSRIYAAAAEGIPRKA